MRLGPDLVRAIQLTVEGAPANRMVGNMTVDGWSEDEVLEHIALLTKASYLKSKIVRVGSGRNRVYAATVDHLTWSGHESLNNARDNNRWRQDKESSWKKQVQSP